MTILYAERPSESPYVQRITQGYTASDGETTRPAEINWHMVLVKQQGSTQLIVTGPWSTAGQVSWDAGAEMLWIRFKPGIYLSHLPTKMFLNMETALPEARSGAFWLKGAAWQFPDYDNVDTFINRLIRQDILVHDPVVCAVLQGQPHEVSPRTVRHRFLHSTGLSHNHIRQVERAQQAETLLKQGRPILDVVHETGYFDQPHLTRSLRQFIGYTPAQIVARTQKSCHSVQDELTVLGYDTNVLNQSA